MPGIWRNGFYPWANPLPGSGITMKYGDLFQIEEHDPDHYRQLVGCKSEVLVNQVII